MWGRSIGKEASKRNRIYFIAQRKINVRIVFGGEIVVLNIEKGLTRQFKI